MRYTGEWESITEKMGYWVDMEHPYITYSNEFIESVWWQFAQISRCSSGFVERVFHVAPQAHRASTSWSLGWMPSFTVDSFDLVGNA